MASGDTNPYPKAAIGCFVRNGDNIYALVCKHVTATASNNFYVHHTGQIFAKKINRKLKEKTPKFNDFDIDLIKVKNKQVENCKPVFRGPEGNIKKARIFEGEHNSLGPVFGMTRKTDKRGTGTILSSSQVDETIRDSYDLGTHFVVEGESFSVDGDSGRIVAYEDNKNDDGFIELLGLIVHKSGNQTVCLKLKDGIMYLNDKYGINLSLYVQEHFTSDDDTFVEPGDDITFPTE